MNKALKTVMFTEDCKDRMRPILTSENISSEESDEEDGVNVFRVRQLPWIRPHAAFEIIVIIWVID